MENLVEYFEVLDWYLNKHINRVDVQGLTNAEPKKS